MYELEPHWRRRLGVARVDAAPALAPAEGLDSAAWTGNEFGGAPLGDQRLSARLVKSAGLLASLPGEAITANASHDRAAVKGYYRLIDQPVSSAVTPGNILAPHRARTLQRMRGQDTVLCIQDGTDLNFATRPNCEGLGIIGRNQTVSKTLGLHLHLTLAVDGAGLPLGVLRCGFEAPPGGAARLADEPPPAAAQETAPKAAQETAPKAAQETAPQDAALGRRAARHRPGGGGVEPQNPSDQRHGPRGGLLRGVRRAAPSEPGGSAGARPP